MPRLKHALLSFCLSLVAIELAGRVLLGRVNFTERLRSLGPTGQLTAELARYESMIRGNRSYPARVEKWHPGWGWTNVLGRLPGEPPVNIDAQGLRGARETPLEHPSGKTRVEIFGDSFALGVDVSDSETYAAQLEDIDPSLEVLNFGVAGYGLDQCLLRFREDGARYHPDTVVIGLVSLLFLRSHSSFERWYKPFFEIENGELVLHGVPVPSPEEAAAKHHATPKIVEIFRMRLGQKPISQEDDPLGVRLLEELVHEIRAARARPVIILYPLPDEYRLGTSTRSPTALGKAFRKVRQNRGVDCEVGSARGRRSTPTLHRVASTAAAAS